MPVVIDIGAHDGSSFALPYSQDPDTTVYAIEPNPILVQQLRSHNRPNLRVYGVAMGEVEGMSAFYLNRDDQTSSLLPATCEGAWQAFAPQLDPVDVIEVPVQRLDDFLRREGIVEVDLLKIDAQGFDFQVLKGAGNALQSIRRIQLEVQLQPLYQGSGSKAEIVAYLSDRGFELVRSMPQTDGLEENLEFVRGNRYHSPEADTTDFEVNVPYVGMLKMPKHDHVGQLLEQGTFECWEQAFLWLYLREGDTFFDCGAHAGLFSAVASQCMAGTGTIVGFEPNPVCLNLYSDNLKKLEFANFKVLGVALSDRDDTANLWLGKEGMSAFSSLAPGATTHSEISQKTIAVTARSLDSLLAELTVEQITLAKLDIEGWEEFALEGAKHAIAAGKFPVWMIEFTEANAIAAGTSTQELWQKLERFGYTLCRFDVNQLQLVPEQQKQQYPYENLIAVMDVAAANARLATASPRRVSIAKDLVVRGDIAVDRQYLLQQFAYLKTIYERQNNQLQKTQTDLEQSQFYLQEAFQNIQQEREQTAAETQQLHTQLYQLYNEGIKDSASRLYQKIKLKLKHITSQENRIIASVKQEGLEASLRKVKQKVKQKLTRSKTSIPPSDRSLLALSGINRDQFWAILDPLIASSIANLSEAAPQISILTPTWNSSLDWFVETAASIFNQTLSNWEWCIVDDGSKHQEIRAVVAELARKHPRIKVSLPEMGQGISGATNQALGLAEGEFICLLDHDDTLAPTAIAEFTQKLEEGFDVVYSDEDKIDISGRHYTEPFHKPSWSPEYFRGVMYVGHLLCVRKELAIAVGRFKSEFDGVQDYEFMLRISEATRKIAHIPKILYHWRKIPGSIATDANAKQRIEHLQVAAVNAHLDRLKLPATSKSADSNHRIVILPKPKITYPLVSIIIPTKDAPEYLEKCLESIFRMTTYPNYEVVLVDNQTTDPKALQIMKKFPVKHVPFSAKFNFSRANNVGVKSSEGDYLVFLNNDTEVITANWLENLLYYAEQPDIGAVGALLLYPDKTVQHAGVVMGFRGTADHVMRGFTYGIDGYAGSLACSREVSAVTAACLMVKKSDFEAIGGFNEHFFTHYQDVDLCLQLVKQGRRNIYTPQAVLIHHESKTRKTYYDMVDRMLLLDLHQSYIDSGDPYYNPNFDMAHFDYTVRTEAC
jgi:FkbM family methyltransferase